MHRRLLRLALVVAACFGLASLVEAQVPIVWHQLQNYSAAGVGDFTYGGHIGAKNHDHMGLYMVLSILGHKTSDCGNTQCGSSGTTTVYSKCIQKSGNPDSPWDNGHGHLYKILSNGEVVDSDPHWHCHCGHPLNYMAENTTTWQPANGPYYWDEYLGPAYKFRITFQDNSSNPLDSSDAALN